MSVVDGAVLTQKDDVESNGGSLEIVAEIFVLSFCGVQLVLRSGVLTILDLDEVDVTPRFAEVFGSVLFGVGAWLYWWLAVLLRCSQSPSNAPCHTKNPPPYICCFCVFAAEGKLLTLLSFIKNVCEFTSSMMLRVCLCKLCLCKAYLLAIGMPSIKA